MVLDAIRIYVVSKYSRKWYKKKRDIANNLEKAENTGARNRIFSLFQIVKCIH